MTSDIAAGLPPASDTREDVRIDGDASRVLFDAALAANRIELIADRADGVYENVLEIRRLAALLRDLPADAMGSDAEPGAIFDLAAIVRAC